MRPSRFRVGVAWLVFAVVIAAAALADAAPQGTSPQAAPAQEEKRGGFVISFGGGFGRTNWGGGHAGVFTCFKIGYAPNERLAIVWHSAGTFSGATDGDRIADGMGGGTVQFYLSSKRGSTAYVLGGAGYHNLMRIKEGFIGGSNSLGFGIRGGAGYEFAPYWTIESVVQHGFNSVEGNPTSFGIYVTFIRR